MTSGNQSEQGQGKWTILYILLLVVVPLICFSPVFNAEFINLDDGRFIKNNDLVNEGDLSNIPQAFSEQYNSPHYKPLVYVSWIIEASVFGTDPFIFHFTNLLLHIFNSLLVFTILQLLFTKINVRKQHILLASFLGAFLFCVHPFKVESVAWAVERKDVLFSFFYLLGLLFYIKYLGKESKTFLVISIFCYGLTLLSKSMGISLLAILFLVDYLHNRKWDRKLILEKIPFIAIAFGALFIYGIFTRYDKVTLGVTEGLLSEEQTAIEPENFEGLHPYYKQILVINFRLLGFIGHFLIPAKLAITYPRAYFLDFPGPFIHVLPLITLLLIFIGIRFRKKVRWFAFGFGFYFLSIFPALMMGDKGTNFLPDRYVYMPSFGILFVIISAIFVYFGNRRTPLLKPVVIVIGVLGILCGIATYNYSKVWKNNLTLWSDAISKYPGMLEVAYKNRATVYRKAGQFDLALKDYVVLEHMKVKEAAIYGNIANIYGIKGNLDKALEYYTKAIERKEDYFNAYLNRGITFAKQNMFKEAFMDFERAYNMDSSSSKLLESYAFANYEVRNYQEAVELYNELLETEKEERFYFQRGLALFNIADYPNALNDFLKVISMNPSNVDALYNASATYYNMGDMGKAWEFANKAAQQGFNIPPSYLQKIQAEMQAG